MATNNLSVSPESIINGDMTQNGGAIAAEQLLALRPRPTAIIAGNDLMAIGVMNRIRQHGLQAGQDIALGGFDDISLAAFTNPPLTTLHQPISDIAVQLCAMLIDLINGRPLNERHNLLTPTLIVRESSGLPIN
jgi:DNA-binding LacI/PurR family transcriptional regulator